MTEINSSIGKITSDQKPMKRYTVDGPEADFGVKENPVETRRRRFQQQQQQPNVPNSRMAYVANNESEEDIFKQAERMRAEKNKMAPDNKNKIEVLLGLKRKYGEITIDDHKIVLRSLSAKESKFIINSAYDIANEKPIDKVYNLRHNTLAFSLFSIDGEEISDIIGDDFDIKLSLIEEMSDEAIAELFKFYEDNIAVKMPQTEKEAKEVIADIKK